MTRLTDRIRTARNPQEALTIIAGALDAQNAVLQQMLDQLAELSKQHTADAWTWQPQIVDETTSEWEDQERARQAKADEIRKVEEALANTHDSEERAALEARLRLLKDTGRSVEPAVAEGQRVIEAEGYTNVGSPLQKITVGGNTVKIPAASPERQDARRKWARRVKLWEFIPLNEDTAVESYAKGGAMWLYLGNRDAVLTMPVKWRRELVRDIQQDSPAQAQEVARDILKREDSVDPRIVVEASGAI